MLLVQLQGYFVQPTVIVNASDSSPLMQEEIFGPVVCVVPFDTELEVSRVAARITVVYVVRAVEGKRLELLSIAKSVDVCARRAYACRYDCFDFLVAKCLTICFNSG